MRVLIAVLALACSSVAFAAETYATQWAGQNEKYYLASGQSGYLNRTVKIYLSEGFGENRAVCAGIRYYGDNCVGRGSTATYSYKATLVESEPYLHNHDEENGYFKGWWYE
jgi:hypothetical protein